MNVNFSKISLKEKFQFSKLYIPTAGDIDLEPELPVGDGVGLIAIEFGVPGVAATPLALQLELSLLF